MQVRTWCWAVTLLPLSILAGEPDDFLIEHLQFVDRDLKHLREGRPVVKALPPSAAHEVAVAGAIRFNGSIPQFLAAFRDLPSFKRAPEVLEVRFVEELPVAQREDLERRARQYPGRERTPDLAAPSRFLADQARPLGRRLQEPTIPGPWEGLEEFTYYSRERILKKPVEILTRVSVYQDPDNRRAFIATSQAYASDYFDGSLGLTALFETADGITLIYINRSRAHALGGALGPLRRALAAKVITTTMAKKLEEMRLRVTSTTAQR